MCTEVYAVEVLSLVNIICKVAETCTELYAVEVLAYSTLCELQWAWAVLTIYMGGIGGPGPPTGTDILWET